MDLHNQYSFINQDLGYQIIQQNNDIDRMFPYKPDIDPRLVRYLRSLYFFIQNNIMPCVPLDMEYSIKKDDVPCMVNYLKKYQIPFSLRNNKKN
jgi:hypothetical protein